MEHIILSLTNNKLLLVSVATPFIPPSVSPLPIHTPTVLTALYSPGNVKHHGGHIIRKYVSIHVFILHIRYFSACVTVHPSHCFLAQCSASHNVQFVLPNRVDESIRRNADVGSHFCSWNLILLFQKMQKKSFLTLWNAQCHICMHQLFYLSVTCLHSILICYLSAE